MPASAVLVVFVGPRRIFGLSDSLVDLVLVTDMSAIIMCISTVVF